nr:cyclic nucleotide-binding domain-containing protein 2-like [Lytechinus pictus]
MHKATAELEEEDQTLSFISHSEGSGEAKELTFDKKYFRAKRETRFTKEVTNVLSLEAEERTLDQLKVALRGLQSISSFAEYPLHIQEKLVRVAYFYSIPEKKVIIRQGHIAENFYFIVTGEVSVVKTEADPITSEVISTEIGRFRKGDCFGELELLHGDPRPCSITAEEPCQIIAIEKEDFMEMFIREGDAGKEIEHLKFLRALPFLKGWPVQKLNEHPQMCLVHFFKRSSVIVRDSNRSEWLYIIKSGSCQVIKQLKDTQSMPAPRRPHQTINPTPEKSAFNPRDGLHIGSKIDSRRRKTFMTSETSSMSLFDDTASPPRRVDKKSSTSPTEEVKEMDRVVFVQVGMLHAKDVFGLPMLCRENGISDVDQPSLSLVSRGAECIMLNKKFYLDEASEFVYRHLKEIVRPYPLGQTLQEHLQLHTNWSNYKKQAVSDVLSKSTSSSSSSTSGSSSQNGSGLSSRRNSNDSSNLAFKPRRSLTQIEIKKGLSS